MTNSTKARSQMSNLKVSEVMTQNTLTAKEADSLISAISTMNLKSLSSLPIVDSAERVCGVLSTSDLIPLAYGLLCDIGVLQCSAESVRTTLTEVLAEDNQSQTVGEFMTRSVKTCGPETSLREAAEELVENEIHHLPVVDNSNRVIGILSTMDIVRSVAFPEK